ncbi:MAG: hypothetical protein LUE87_04475, partial [Lachnospiraceae bacterium]|nr:hypothetical protein [Lachnospiraceae bacterium]
MFRRLLGTAQVKNTYRYIDTQKKYEIIRTALLFGVALALFAGGYAATETRNNLLTVVAILGCLPASKSLVSAIMFCRFHSASGEIHQAVAAFDETQDTLYDLVFTTQKVNYVADHCCLIGNELVLLAQDRTVDKKGLEAHLHEMLRKAGVGKVNIGIFTELRRYTDRLNALAASERAEYKDAALLLESVKE